MSRKETKVRREAFKHDAEGVLAILNRWDPIPGSPADEYECLAHLLLGVLQRGAPKTAVEALIRREMCDHFGVDVSSGDVAALAHELAAWWRARGK